MRRRILHISSLEFDMVRIRAGNMRVVSDVSLRPHCAPSLCFCAFGPMTCCSGVPGVSAPTRSDSIILIPALNRRRQRARNSHLVAPSTLGFGRLRRHPPPSVTGISGAGQSCRERNSGREAVTMSVLHSHSEGGNVISKANIPPHNPSCTWRWICP